jgi:hypothetical protein
MGTAIASAPTTNELRKPVGGCDNIEFNEHGVECSDSGARRWRHARPIGCVVQDRYKSFGRGYRESGRNSNTACASTL